MSTEEKENIRILRLLKMVERDEIENRNQEKDFLENFHQSSLVDWFENTNQKINHYGVIHCY